MNRYTLEFLDKELEKNFVSYVYGVTCSIYKISQLITIPIFIWYGIYFITIERFITSAISFSVVVGLISLYFLANMERHFQLVTLAQLVLYIPFPMISFYLNFDGGFDEVNCFFVGFCSTYYYASLIHGCKSPYKFIVGIVQLGLNFFLEIYQNGYTQGKVISTSFYLLNMIQQYFIDKNFRQSYLLIKKNQIWMKTMDQAIDIMIIQGYISRGDNTIVFVSSNQRCQSEFGIRSTIEFIEFTRRFMVESHSFPTTHKRQTLEQSYFYFLHSASKEQYKKTGIYKNKSYEIQMLQYLEDGREVAVFILKSLLKEALQISSLQTASLQINILMKSIKNIQQSIRHNMILLNKSKHMRSKLLNYKMTELAIMSLNLRYLCQPLQQIRIITFSIQEIIVKIRNTFLPIFTFHQIQLICSNHKLMQVTSSKECFYHILYNIIFYLVRQLKFMDETKLNKQMVIEIKEVKNTNLFVDEIVIIVRQNFANQFTLIPLPLKKCKQNDKINLDPNVFDCLFQV